MLWSSGISWKSGALIVRYSQKKEWISFVFYCFENPSIAQNFATTGPIGGVFSNIYLHKWVRQSNRKLKMSHLRLQTDFPRSHHIFQWTECVLLTRYHRLSKEPLGQAQACLYSFWCISPCWFQIWKQYVTNLIFEFFLNKNEGGDCK